MPRSRRSSALLLLLLVPIALVAIVALWLHDGDDDSVSGSGWLAAETEAELPAALRETSQPAAAAPSPKAAARTVESRTDTAPLPGLPGGPPQQERLSPFRVVAGKSKRDGR